jgi:hypothetical protein
MTLLVQITSPFSPLPGLIVQSLSISIAPGLMTATGNGSLGGSNVTVDLSSAAATSGNSSTRVGSIRITSPSAAGMGALLAAQASKVMSDLGIQVPAGDTGPDNSISNSSSPLNAEVVLDSDSGLRLLNFSLSNSRLSLGNLASKIGFSWQGSEGTDVVSFLGPRLYYVPSKPGAPSLEWMGRSLNAMELGVTSTVEMPVLGMPGAQGTLLVQAGGILKLRVGGCEPARTVPVLLAAQATRGCAASICARCQHN